MNRFEWLFQKSVALMILFLLLVFPSGEILAAANYDSLESMTNGILVSEKDMIDGYYQFSPIISEASEIRFSDNWDNEFCLYGEQDAKIVSGWWKQADTTGWSNTRSFIASDDRKRKMYVDYTNVGTYQGKQINLRITFLDWEKPLNLPDDSYTSVIVSVDDSKPVIDIKGLLSITVQFSYFDEAMEPISLEGHFTLSDLDFYQGFLVHDRIDHIYFNQSAENRMGYEEETGIIWADGSETTPQNSNGWVTYTYSGDSQTLTFLTGDKNPKGTYYHRIDYNNWANDSMMKKWKGIYNTQGGDTLAWMTSEFGYTSEIMCQFTKKADLLIEKTDADSGEILCDVRFALFEYDGTGWKSIGFLEWEEETKRYVRYNLEYTEENQGRFRVVEEVPDGYVGEWTQEFVVNQPGTETILFQVANQRGKGQIKVTKTDKETKELLSGTVFQIIADENICTPGGQLIYEKGEVADTITTEKGVAVSKKLDYGTYRIKEIQPTTGYLLGEETKQVTLSWKDADTSLITEEL
ncbi:MAG: prealbumin-like fold domain-containing protein, partial [Lachnospiraceae bacterium]|nr:prealbumin-like fold domain-containing protein [Lachnospiraceae bacterium]